MKLLIIDDEHDQELRETVQRDWPDVITARNLKEARAALADGVPDIIVMDAMFPEGPSDPEIGFLAGVFLRDLETCVDEQSARMPDIILVSGQKKAADYYDDVSDWLNSGLIRDVLPKSVADSGWSFFQCILCNKLNGLRKERATATAYGPLQDAFSSLAQFGIVTADPKMVPVWEKICDAATYGILVSIQGESGTGKELVAKAIAKLRNRNCRSVNCAAIGEHIFEGEVFGTCKGGATGVLDRPGLIEQAGDGVLFLDEICSLHPPHQPKLLRVIEYGEFDRVGDLRTRKAACTFVVADHLPLDQAMREGKLRQDLYYRLNRLVIVLPPLRERRGDIRLLANHFVDKFSRQFRKHVSLSDDVLSLFESGSWTGNIRSLEATVQKVVVGHKERSAVDCKALARLLTSADLREIRPEAVDIVDGDRAMVPLDSATVPLEPRALLTQLRTELRYTKPPTWRALKTSRARSKTEPVEQTLLKGLEDVLNPRGLELLHCLRTFLENRIDDSGQEMNNPLPQHHYTTLLYLALKPEHRATKAELQSVCALSGQPLKTVAENLSCDLRDQLQKLRNRLSNQSTDLNAGKVQLRNTVDEHLRFLSAASATSLATFDTNNPRNAGILELNEALLPVEQHLMEASGAGI